MRGVGLLPLAVLGRVLTLTLAIWATRIEVAWAENVHCNKTEGGGSHLSSQRRSVEEMPAPPLPRLTGFGMIRLKPQPVT
jgi:hypothetical protein